MLLEVEIIFPLYCLFLCHAVGAKGTYCKRQMITYSNKCGLGLGYKSLMVNPDTPGSVVDV
jgi:hypothetical protein